ncbi:MAG: RES family NAD+ phosphorylase [Acidobacteriota bacterium]
MKLVDTLDEQERIERVIEQTKPRIPADCRHLHYLLSTPFRYGAPYPRGSRFRRAGFTPGVFYASRTPVTAIAEMAFHRLLFFADSPGTPWPANAGEFTAFAVMVRTRAALDLRKPPFAAHHAAWTHPTDYGPCQHLAEQARVAGIDVLCGKSARDPAGGLNIALLNCRAFGSREPVARQTWRIDLSSSGVRGVCAFPETKLEFDRVAFASDPRMTALEWTR